MKITFLGAGSSFAPRLSKDVFLTEAIPAGTFALVDVDAERLELSHRLIERINEALGGRWTIEASTDLTRVLPDSDYVINCIEVNGSQTIQLDNDIPLKYGVTQCIGDTIGPGGVFKALRTAPVWLSILDDVQRLAPRALVLNYTNPMSILTLAGIRKTGLPIVGLCHSVQGSSRDLAGYLNLEYDELFWTCAGINHNAWFTRLEHEGRDLYPELKRRYEQEPERFEKDIVRMEFMYHFGYYVTESSAHFSEYVPWFRKREDLVNKYCGEHARSGLYAEFWPRERREKDDQRRRILAGEEPLQGLEERSYEYAADIIAAHQSDVPAVIWGNVVNGCAIANLPAEACVEVACLVDRRGIAPTVFGPLPEACAAVNRSHTCVHELMVEALLSHNREAAIHALMLDPHTASVCSLAEIRAMFEELWAAEIDYMPREML